MASASLRAGTAATCTAYPPSAAALVAAAAGGAVVDSLTGGADVVRDAGAGREAAAADVGDAAAAGFGAGFADDDVFLLSTGVAFGGAVLSAAALATADTAFAAVLGGSGFTSSAG